MNLPAIHTAHGRRSLALFGYVISRRANVNAPVLTLTGPIRGQVNDNTPSALSDLRHICQDIREDIAELPEVFHRLSCASFERPNIDPSERSNGEKAFPKWKK